MSIDGCTTSRGNTVFGMRNADIAVTQVQILYASGTIQDGAKLSVYGVTN
jgi:hypothetical protein